MLLYSVFEVFQHKTLAVFSIVNAHYAYPAMAGALSRKRSVLLSSEQLVLEWDTG